MKLQLKRNEIRAFVGDNPDTIRVIEALFRLVNELEKKVQDLESRVSDLEEV